MREYNKPENNNIEENGFFSLFLEGVSLYFGCAIQNLT